MSENRWNINNIYSNGYNYTGINNNIENIEEKDIKGLLKKNRILQYKLNNSLELIEKLKLDILILNNELKKIQS